MRPRYVRQNGFWSGSGKISLRLYFRGDYGQSRLEYPLIPSSDVEQFATVVLRAGHNDQTNPFIKDELLRRLHKDMGQAACMGTFANLFINGEYKGFYNPTEQVKEESCQEWFDSDRSWDVMTMNGVRDGDTVSFDAMVNYARGHNLADPVLLRRDGQEARRGLLHRLPHHPPVAQRLGLAAEQLVGGLRALRDGPVEVLRLGCRGHLRVRPVAARPVHRARTNQGNANGYLYQALRANPDFRRLFADRVYKHFYNGGALTEENIQKRFYDLRDTLQSVIPAHEHVHH